jgi:hypothetical protein
VLISWQSRKKANFALVDLCNKRPRTEEEIKMVEAEKDQKKSFLKALNEDLDTVDLKIIKLASEAIDARNNSWVTL